MDTKLFFHVMEIKKTWIEFTMCFRHYVCIFYLDAIQLETVSADNIGP